MPEDPGGRLGRRLSRILLMLPYAIQHPGVTVGELASKFGVDKRDLLDDLNLVFMCGLPGYGPGDLIDVDLDEDRVYVRMADYFAAPLRLAPAEALVLYAGAATLVELPGMQEAEALRRALTKLGRALGGSADRSIEVALDTAGTANLDVVRTAIADGRKLAVEYFSASRGELTERTLDPWGLVAALGRWYLVAFDHVRAEERMFRIDRMKSATILDEGASIPKNFDPEEYRGAFRAEPEEPVAVFEISPRAARWFPDYYPVQDDTPLEDGWHRIKMVVSGEHWAATLALQLGAEIRAIEPPSITERAAELARALIDAHS